MWCPVFRSVSCFLFFVFAWKLSTPSIHHIIAVVDVDEYKLPVLDAGEPPINA